MKEIEVLVELLEDKQSALKKLSKIGKAKLNQTHDIYYSHEHNHKLKPKGFSFPKECFRIRLKSKKAFLAYKVDNFDEKGTWIYSDEYETEVKDFNTTNKIIELLGFTKLIELENKKYTFETKEYEIVLEEVKELGLFLETELKNPENLDPKKVKIQINEFIKSLGLKTSKEINAGKPELMLKKKEPNMRTTQLECIVFRRKNDSYEFLILKRIPNKGGFWQPVCGGMEKEDKSLLDAAFRELEEEANIQKKDILNVLEDVHYFEINKHYLTGKPISTIKEYVLGFEVKPDTKVTIGKNISAEHDEIKWVTFKEALKLLKWKDNKKGFRKLNALIAATPLK